MAIKSKNGRTISEIVAANFGVADHEVTSDTNLERDLDADSLDSVELCMKVEAEFDIRIEDSAWEKCSTVGHIEALVVSYAL
jgi:acyl carrier protein